VSSFSFPLNLGGPTINEVEPRSMLTRPSRFMSDDVAGVARFVVQPLHLPEVTVGKKGIAPK